MRILLNILLLFAVIGVFAQADRIPKKELNGTSYYVYTVQSGDGLYRLSKNFGTTQSELNSLNPQIQDGLNAGLEILIPVIEGFTPTIVINETQAVNQNPAFIEHIVVKKQTVFAICQQYQITQEEFNALNPEITKTKLKSGQVVKIPVHSNVKADTLPVLKNEETTEKIITNKKKSFKIAFLLPFMLQQGKSDLAVKRFVEFHSGAVLALQEFKKLGLSFEIHTYDTEKSETKLAEIFEDSLLLTMDLVVGPAYTSQVSMIGDFARMHKMKTIIPFTSKIIDISTNPWLYQFNPGQEVEIKNITEYIQKNFREANILLVQTEQANLADDNNLIPALQKSLLDNQLEFNNVLLTDSTVMSEWINPEKENIVFFNSGKINQVSKQLKELKAMQKDSAKILVYEPLSWKNSKAEKPLTFSFSPFKSNYFNENYIEYQSEYQKLFGSVPDESFPRYDLIGYDLIKYSIPNILQQTIKNQINLNEEKGLQSDIKFIRPNAYSGFINENMNLLKSTEN